MFKKQLIVLDTDYKDYLVIYTCNGNAEFTDKNNNEVFPEDIFKASVNQRTFHDLP